MPRPAKTDLAKFKVMNDLGLTPNNIGKGTGFDPKTVRRYLTNEVYQDPEVQSIVARIKERELADLYLLGAKARKRLHELFDEGNTKVIETTAVMDRSFQQRQLLEGKPTANINFRGVLEEVDNSIRKVERELRELEEGGK